MQQPTTLELVRDRTPATYPAAKKLYDQANHSASEAVGRAIACGRMLRALRDSCSGSGGDRKSAAFKADQKANAGLLIFSEELKKVGIPLSTAKDWMDQVDRFEEIQAISAGETKMLTIDVETPDGIKQVEKPLKAADRERAAKQLAEIHAGKLWPKRAWAGFRSGLVTASAKRAPANVYHLIREHVAGLDRQLPKLSTLSDEERLELKKLAIKTQIIERIAALEELQ